MTSGSNRRPVTKIREEFTPSPQLFDALNGFYERPNSALALHTIAERTVDLQDYYENRHAAEIMLAERRILLLASRALTLSPMVHITDTGPSFNLLFNVNEGRAFTQITDALSEISGVESTPGKRPGILSLELAKESLANSLACNRARDELISGLRDPVTSRRMTVYGPRLVTKDVLYPPRGRLFSPDDK